MAKKYYAVKEGRVKGIFTSWDDCKAQVHGFGGAVYKSFTSLAEAEAYLAGEGSRKNEFSELSSSAEAIAYVDGSYRLDTQEYSYGVLIFYQGQEWQFAEKFADVELAEMRNVAGEIKGAEKAIAFCLEQGIKSVAIYHDYEGIARWCTGEWQAKKFGTQQYRDFYQQAVGQGLQVEFIKVKGHSGNRYNDVVDALAKSALGIGVTDK